jgi:hypothetical protein
MRHFTRPNRVAYGILRRQHPKVLTLLEQNDRVRLRPRQVSGEIPAAMRRQSSIARPSHRTCAVSEPLCARGLLPSPIMCVGNQPLLRVGPSIIARRHRYAASAENRVSSCRVSRPAIHRHRRASTRCCPPANAQVWRQYWCGTPAAARPASLLAGSGWSGREPPG